MEENLFFVSEGCLASTETLLQETNKSMRNGHYITVSNRQFLANNQFFPNNGSRRERRGSVLSPREE